MVIELVGPDSSPVLFLLTEQDTVEFVRILDSAAYGTMVSSGPAYGIGAAGDLDPDPPKLVGFEAGMNETGGTVYILCDNGERFDLSIELGSSRERFPADLCAAWEASLLNPKNRRPTIWRSFPMIRSESLYFVILLLTITWNIRECWIALAWMRQVCSTDIP